MRAKRAKSAYPTFVACLPRFFTLPASCPGFVPGIHDFRAAPAHSWMAGPAPGQDGGGVDANRTGKV